MLTRRHIRVKVMQSLYALMSDETNDKIALRNFLDKSMADMYDLFLLNLSLLVETKNFARDFIEKSRKMHLATEADKNPNVKFVDNLLIAKFEDCDELNDALEKRGLNNWLKEPHYVKVIWDALRESELYADYTSSRETSFKDDKTFVVEIFREIIAPNEKLHDYLEDSKLTWVDDMPIVNTAISKGLKKVKPDEPFSLPKLFKNLDDREFGFELLYKTLEKQDEFERNITEKTPNWDKDRLADIDAILIKMAISEFIDFPSIPIKVSINEYLEIAKEYSTPKSRVFINGVLDKISKDYEKSGRLNKMGRGLI